MDAATFAEIRLGAHLHECLPCVNAQRWAHMCEDGKTMYDTMLAARYAAAREEEEIRGQAAERPDRPDLR